MSFLTFLTPTNILRFVALAAIAVVIFIFYQFSYNRGAAAVTQKYTAEKLAMANESVKILTESIKINKDLQASVETQRGEANAQIKSINKSISAVITGLRDRPDRNNKTDTVPANSSGTCPVSGSSCSGAGLYKQDAEFLIGETARTEQLKIALNQCEAQYNLVKAKVNGFGADTSTK